MTIKVMSNRELFEVLSAEVIKVDDHNVLDQEPIKAIYADVTPTLSIVIPEDHKGSKLDYKLTVDDLDGINKFNSNFLEVYGKSASAKIGELVRDNKDIAALDLTVSCGTTEFSTVFARPTAEEPTEKEWAASIGFGMSHPKSKALEGKIRKEFGKSFFEEEDEE